MLKRCPLFFSQGAFTSVHSENTFVDSQCAYFAAYQQALGDFGVLDLLEALRTCCNSDRTPLWKDLQEEAIVLLQPNAQHSTISRFRNRQDAEDQVRWRSLCEARIVAAVPAIPEF